MALHEPKEDVLTAAVTVRRGSLEFSRRMDGGNRSEQLRRTKSALDADVTSIEASRSRMEILAAVHAAGYRRGVGPGVYDIHSARVPSVAEIVEALRLATAAVPADRLWVNPDCGLKPTAIPKSRPRWPTSWRRPS
jgi:methionine synthase II (cobalamin-independent)